MNEAWSYILVNLVDVLQETMVFWAPIILAAIAARLWLHYKKESFITNMKWVMLEVRVPSDVQKSPMAMELFLSNALYHTSNPGWYDIWVKGDARVWSSLELVSINGSIHFIMRIPAHIKDLVESQLYAQYPQVEVTEVEDYVYAVPPLSKDSGWDAFVAEYGLEKPDPLPIKTYFDFGLDKDPKEEFKIDPITATIEFLGAIGEGEQLWIQLGVRATEKLYHSEGTRWGRHNWMQEVKHFIDSRVEKYAPKEQGLFPGMMPKTVDEEITMARKKSNKLAFDCVLRVVYVARKDRFNSNVKKNMKMLFRQYSHPNFNGLKGTNATKFDYEWQEKGGALLALKEKMINFYKERQFFHPPLRESVIPVVFVLNTEEIASIYHFPGEVSATPTLRRLESRTSKSPWNLPT